jgi:hypothetical protein
MNRSSINKARLTMTTPDGKRSRHFVKIVAATAALAGLLFGFDTGVISGAILFIKENLGYRRLQKRC